MVSSSYSLARLTITCVIWAICCMNSSRLICPFSIWDNLNSHSPVSSGKVNSLTPSPFNKVISWNAFGVGISSRPSRKRYFSVRSPSIIAARVAGVPRPFPCMASLSSSSTNLPAPSIAESRVASEYRAGGFVASSSTSTLSARTFSP